MELTEHQQRIVTRLIAGLRTAAAEVRTLEQQAKAFLHEHGDQQGYRHQLRQKAILLSELADELPQDDDLPLPLIALVQEKVGSLSFEAERSLRLDSIFYMSVLLYPEDYQEGGLNELESLVDSLTQAWACRSPNLP